VGWGRDFYWSSMGRLARVVVQKESDDE